MQRHVHDLGLGAALLGGVRSGVYADAHEAVAAAVRVTARVEPEASWLPTYANGYQNYRSLYPTLRPISNL